ncbi:Geranylgeranyl transferase type-1 subunit beta [Yarrowia sp. E02]|nr:Geranylgeranyl transferase type-1 subunit beta [Yarrowia sp. E02]
METAKHTKYFSRCLFLLPAQATAYDGNRLSIVYFCLSGLDLLGTLDQFIKTPEQRKEYIEWIYEQVVESGAGFRGSPTFKMCLHEEDKGDKYDPANLAATFFGLACLGILGATDIWTRLSRDKILTQVASCQREDGSFGSFCIDGKVAPDYDMRNCYLATGIRRLARDQDSNSRDIDLSSMVQHIKNTQTFQGGLGQGQTGDVTEPHSGLTYCGLSALKNVDQLDEKEWIKTLDWLVARQVDERHSTQVEGAKEGDKEGKQEESVDESSDDSEDEDPQHGGFNGRVGKLVDTCYSFWVSASLASLGGVEYVSGELARDYLLKNTQNPLLGGFGKTPGQIPDPLHSYLGLCALSIFGQPGLGKIVPELCISERAVKVLTGQ